MHVCIYWLFTFYWDTVSCNSGLGLVPYPAIAFNRDPDIKHEFSHVWQGWLLPNQSCQLCTSGHAFPSMPTESAFEIITIQILCKFTETWHVFHLHCSHFCHVWCTGSTVICAGFCWGRSWEGSAGQGEQWHSVVFSKMSCDERTWGELLLTWLSHALDILDSTSRPWTWLGMLGSSFSC